MISAASLAGCDAAKFQKRTIEVVYTPWIDERHIYGPANSLPWLWKGRSTARFAKIRQIEAQERAEPEEGGIIA